jgi:mannose-6-phosphate isomerase
VDLLENTIQPYAWGSHTALATLRGAPAPAPGPEAELWMGAHPLAPSQVVRGGERRSLADVIAEAPEAELGARAARDHEGQLPFLLKVLAADQPLSLQAHPDAAQAREGFAREEAAGVPRTAPHRNYRDPWPKPELLCALEPFDALCGFRPAAEARAVLDALDTPALDPVRERLDASWRTDPVALREAFTWLATLPAPARAPLVEATVAAAARARPGPFADAFAWTPRLAALHPGDPGVVIALLLRLIHLQPGEALYLPAGNLHAYLRGVGVEVMATSDNVLRGGLTPKHVDVDELLRVLHFRAEPVPVLRPRPGWPGEEVYPTHARHFELSRVELAGAPFRATVGGPEILLCTEGAVAAVGADGERLALARGQSAFVPARTAAYALEGHGVAFRAAMPRR